MTNTPALMNPALLAHALNSVKFQEPYRASRYSLQVMTDDSTWTVLPIKRGLVDVAPLVALGGFDFLTESLED